MESVRGTRGKRSIDFFAALHNISVAEGVFTSDFSNHKVQITLEYKPAISTEEERQRIDQDTAANL